MSGLTNVNEMEELSSNVIDSANIISFGFLISSQCIKSDLNNVVYTENSNWKQVKSQLHQN